MLVPKGVLGHSATALVEKVRCKRIMLARKKIQCSWRVKREDMIEEVAHLQRLSHAHIVRGVGTYVIGKELSILLYPATTHNLEAFLTEYTELNDQPRTSASLPLLFSMKAALDNFMKCLVHTIAFVHANLIKHMDIKPTNLLVQEKLFGNRFEYKIYLADFGIAKSYRAVVDVETDSPTPFSRTYAAPEVILQDTRGFPADIFSLGCVFLEIEAVLKNQMKEVTKIRSKNANNDLSYQANLPDLFATALLNGEAWRIRYIRHTSDNWIRIEPNSMLASNCSRHWDVIRLMLDQNPAKRPTAGGLRRIFGDEEPCCLTGPEPFEVADSPPYSAMAALQE
jgi:serine/threonine protein kinase